jgi:hypothetical protein
MMAALLFEPFLFLPLDFLWAFFFSSFAAWVKCGCVDLSVSATFQCVPYFIPFVCDERMTTFGGTSNGSLLLVFLIHRSVQSVLQRYFITGDVIFILAPLLLALEK